MSKFIKNHPSAIKVWLFYKRKEGKSGLYERLCNVIGKNEISEEEFKELFDKMMTEDKESKKKEINQLVIQNQANLRLCILSDVIDEKHIDESFLNISELIPSIDYQDFEFWFNRFSSGNWNLDQKTFSDLPFETLAKIAENLNFWSQMRLRKLSHGLRNIVDQGKPAIDMLSYKYTMIGTQETVFFSFSEGYKYCYLGENNLERAFNDMKNILSNPKLQLTTFHWNNELSPEIDEKLVEFLGSLDGKLEIGYPKLDKMKKETMMALLKAIKPGSLQSIKIESPLERVNMRKFVELDQWKQAKKVIYSENVNFKSCQIQTENLPSTIEICEILNIPVVYHDLSVYFGRYSIPGSRDVLEFKADSSRFFVTRKSVELVDNERFFIF
uniref:F-box domain-containing protein n=1 Tax=Caenorhabditis tropicalis TaxID=1561998 RepID=A0A1I7UI90_9PELO